MKAHLDVEGAWGRRRAACGNGKKLVRKTSDVTCAQCMSTMAYRRVRRAEGAEITKSLDAAVAMLNESEGPK